MSTVIVPFRPVFMMHSLLEKQGWSYDFLATRRDELDRLIWTCRKLGLRFIRARDWSAATNHSVCLTFDDGFLDNWTLLHPLLVRESVPFTIFVCRDFIEDGEDTRPEGLALPGYLNRGELRAMESMGLADIQSHSATHTWYPVRATVESIFSTGDERNAPWLLWNEAPERKPHWLTEDYKKYVGHPVLVADRSLRARRVLLDEELWSRFCERVQSEELGVEAANSLLLSEYSAIARPESVEEARVRYLEEIRGNADTLEELLGRRPTVLCWPGGAYNELSLQVAKEEGFVTTRNIGFGTNPTCMHRLSPINPHGRRRFPWKYQTPTLLYYLARHAWGWYRHKTTNTPPIGG